MGSKQSRKQPKLPSWSWTLTTGAFLIVLITIAWFIKEPGFEPLAAAVPSFLAILVYFGLRKSAYQEKFDQIIAVLMVIITIPLVLFLFFRDQNSFFASSEELDNIDTSVPLQCETQIIHGFGKVWFENPEVGYNLGCPESLNDIEKETTTISQSFEEGIIISFQVEETQTSSNIFVLFSDGTYQPFMNLYDTRGSAVQESSEDSYPVASVFSGVYTRGTNVNVGNRLGIATSLEKISDSVYQLFENGMMLWIKDVDQIYVFYSGDSSLQPFHWDIFADSFDSFALPRETENSSQISECNIQLSGGFEIVWDENPNVGDRLGCPILSTEDSDSTQVAVQHFDGGLMIALPNEQDLLKVYVLFADNSFLSFDNLEIKPHPEDGAYTIQDHYFVGRLMSGPYYYEISSDTRKALGFATTPEMEGVGEVQQFNAGIMIWLKELDQIYVLMRTKAEASNNLYEWMVFEDDFDAFTMPDH